MKYTAADITIFHPFTYNMSGLDITYDLKGGRNTHCFSNLALMKALKATGCILDFNEQVPEVRKATGGWTTLLLFVEEVFNDQMAEELILYYLNNRTVKPEKTSI